MNPDETVYESIDLYLNGKLEGEALSAFTDKLESDKEFSILVLNQKAANDIIIGNRLSLVKQMMDADFKANDVKNTITKWGLGGLLGLSLLACGVFYLSDKSAPATSYELARHVNKIPSNNISSNPDKQHTKQINQPSYKKAAIHIIAGTDTTNIKAPVTGTHTYSDKENNTFSPVNGFNQKITDINDVNQLSDNSINIQKKDICLGVIIEGILAIDAACANKNDGEIHIIENSMRGGQAPYTYSLINQANDTIRKETTSFVSLSTGQYKLFFEDAN
ncbi:MAG TPA: SprB repeat-containing protein, partial [Cytophaga sp.]|nr:SprB repeat-containing protein [Cytophaga sp.]